MLDLTAPFVDPLPLYSQRDPDSASILSATPSYISEAPPYTSAALPSQRQNQASSSSSLLPPLTPGQQSQTRGLPPVRYAPGFTSRAPSISTSSITEPWNSPLTSQNSRQYLAVARRRANQAAEDTAILNSLNAVATLTSSSPSTTSSATSISSDSYPVILGTRTTPVTPLEDPYLVGEEAAERARQQRVYREMCLRESEVVGYEGVVGILCMGRWMIGERGRGR
ncbi:hypothetical protein B0J11DRAFT_61519 [Dendryphion nanum]|uniref:Uncharacterized protein n=1 Tax=Dendryphion nanum TaxID=256645 RepID=A0A9P9IIZ7_9PLEO|nr:hypothetical protein B0J11DRAFT_61519 [Dendryphion nanum]